jgi:D-serine deaminase-like pyridoxal phosphate-dependent protein
MLVIDAGALALSKGVSPSVFRSDFGCGLVYQLPTAASCTTGLLVKDVYQEHGLVGTVHGRAPDWSKYPIGSWLRILPSHACMTAAAFAEFHVVDERGLVAATWDKASYWF